MLFEAGSLGRCFEELGTLYRRNRCLPCISMRISRPARKLSKRIRSAQIDPETCAARTRRIKVAALNHRGVKIAREAREAAAHEVLIAGSIGTPLGIGPGFAQLASAEVAEIYREQALALEERGVDLFLLETFSNLDVLLTAIDAIRSFSALPIVPAQLTFSEEATTSRRHPSGCRCREASGEKRPGHRR